MMDPFELGSEFFALLEQIDAEIAARVVAEGCAKCGGPLHQSNYDRKPNGGFIAPMGEDSVKRFSFCCGREGCRKRATPPSVRFLGRRFYLGVVVILASIVARVLEAAGEIRRVTGVPARTTRRWLAWWQGAFLSTEVFVWLRGQLIDVSVNELPTSLVDRLKGSWTSRMTTMLQWLVPVTTNSVRDGSRFLRDCK